MIPAILLAAWLTPALIAGALGWSGIWGTGSALVEFLLPLPVAGGVLHVPSFVLAVAVIARTRSRPAGRRVVALAAFAVCAAAAALALDADRLVASLVSDYSPAGSLLRFDANALLLFVGSDAFWVGTWALAAVDVVPLRHWIVVPAAAGAVLAVRTFGLVSGEPRFIAGGTFPGPERGEEVALVYTTAGYAEERLLGWLAGSGGVTPPAQNPNAEHLAVFFSSSRDLVERRSLDLLDSARTVATVCLYEEDESIQPHPGYYDCFAERATVSAELAAAAAAARTGLGPEVDAWAGRLALCAGAPLPAEPRRDVERERLCADLDSERDALARRLARRYGIDSPERRFVIATKL